MSITGFSLVDSANQQEIRPLENGDVIQVSPNDAFAIECLASPALDENENFDIGSAFMSDNHGTGHDVENYPPYVLADRGNGDYNPSPLYDFPGEWIVVCQLFCGENLTGAATASFTVRFFVEQVP